LNFIRLLTRRNCWLREGTWRHAGNYCVLGRGKVLGQPVIQQIAERRGLSEAAIILRWVMQKGVVPLVQTTKRKNAEGNLAALDFTLSEVEMNSISSLNARNERFISGGSWAPDWKDGE
jgi:diketogulonate reductase-like aldo/keto reductase